MAAKYKNKIITFYSYKGGTGRTQLLANLAAYLCYYENKKVLMIDWDLEAPGLDYYFGFNRKEIEKGLIEVFEDYVRLVNEPQKKVEEKDLPTFKESIYEIYKQSKGGRLDFIPAANYGDDDYTHRIASFNWFDFYDRLQGKYYIEFIKDYLNGLDYDVIFIDSRTGISDYLGICNIQMPEKNVIVVAPTNQNLDGSYNIIQRIMESPYTQTNRTNPIILPIFSRIDTSEQESFKSWRVTFEEKFKNIIERSLPNEPVSEFISDTTIIYATNLAYGEKLLFSKEVVPIIPDSVERKFVNILEKLEILNKPETTKGADTSQFVLNKTEVQSDNIIIIQGVSDNTLTLNVNGTVQEIHNQLADLKALLQNLKAPTVQVADKIYNMKQINEANFGFVTGKESFNEGLTKQLIEAIRPYATPARIFLEKVANIPNWETQLRISDKAKEIIAYSFVGVIGIQLNKLMAIGKEDFSEAKQQKYILKCVYVAKISLDLVCFALISKLWDAQKQKPRHLSDAQKEVLTRRFDDGFGSSIGEQLQLLRVLFEVFSRAENGLTLPLPELEGAAEWLQEGSDFHQTCQGLQSLHEKLDRSQFDLLDCHEAGTKLAAFFKYFHFLVNYHMASIKSISFEQIRNANPRYLHRYIALGIDSKANVNAEKVLYINHAVSPQSVLIYRGDNYENHIDLFPFVIDYNTLTFEHDSKICFYLSQDINDGSLEYLFLEDNSIVNLKSEGIMKPDTDLNELMMNNKHRKTLNLRSVVEQFWEARRCILGDELNFDDL